MKTRFRGGLWVLALLLGVALLASPIVYAQAPAEHGTGDQLVKIGVNNVEEKIDCLISFVQDPEYMSAEDIVTVPDNFKFDSGLMAQIETEVGPEGYIITQAEEAAPTVNAIIRSALEAIQQSVSLADQRIVQALLDNLENVPDDYCDLTDLEAYEEPGRELDIGAKGIDNGGSGDHQPDPYPEPEGDWIYYGKKYNVPDDVYEIGNGVLSLTEPFHIDEDSYPPAIAPLLLFTGDGWGGDVSIPGDVFESPSVSSAESGSFYRYAYNTQENATTGPFSATLYMNENSEESDWIAFSYGDVDLPEGYEAFVGLLPGNGSESHPGPGEPRNTDDGWLDLSDEAGVSYPPDDGKYWWLCEVFDYSDFDLADSFLVFRPDGQNKYTVTFGTRDMVVDSLGLDGNPTILDKAIDNLKDSNLLATVDDGYFEPGEFEFGGSWLDYGDDAGYEYWDGEYEYGLQTVGGDPYWSSNDYGGYYYSSEAKCFTNDETLNRINSNGLLAYAVQVEEDIVNKKILETQSVRSVADSVKDATATAGIRARDAWFVQNADAMSGRVTKDHDGNWVRAQQYVLRSGDNKTIQLLNVCLRGENAGDLAGLSTMSFTTNLEDSYDGDLWRLPWGDWLNTKPDKEPSQEGDGIMKWVEYPMYLGPDTLTPGLANMSVEFKNNGDESLGEYRQFGGDPWDETGVGTIASLPPRYQQITNDKLTIANLTDSSGEYNNDYVAGTVEYDVEPWSEGGFSYVSLTGDSNRFDVAFYEAEDGDRGLETECAVEYQGSIDDIWDALRADERGLPWSDWGPEIEGNLEILISNAEGTNFFSNPIDVVYIPMSHMLWKGMEMPD